MPDENAQLIIQPALQNVTKDINEIVNKQFQLKQAAQNFLDNVNKILKIYEETKEHDLKLFRKGGMSLSDFYVKMNKTTRTLKRLVKQQYIFQKALNDFLDREIILLFVDDNGNFLYGDESLIYNYVSPEYKARGRGNISGSIKKQLMDFPLDIPKSFQNIYNNRLKTHKGIYDEAMRRLKTNRRGGESKKLHNYLKAHNLLSTFWWERDLSASKLDERYGWSRTTSEGNLGEAYASLVWQNEHHKVFNQYNQFAIKEFYDYMVEHGIYDNVSGIVKGDVSFLAQDFSNVAIQFAVKSTNASTGRIGSYLFMAALLMSQNFNITKDTISYVLKNFDSYLATATRSGLEAATNRINEEIQKLGLI